MDKIFFTNNINKSTNFLVAITCVILAAKMNENNDRVNPESMLMTDLGIKNIQFVESFFIFEYNIVNKYI